MPVAAITGASGLLGGNLAAELCAQGWTVRATRRSSTKTDHLSDLPIAWVPGDLDDVPALTAAFRGADVVFHCAAQVSIRKLKEIHTATHPARLDKRDDESE